jgi:O-antigen/teichoic acid export membrane protein
VIIGKQLKQLGGETIVYGISGTISRFIGIFLVPLYTRVFSPEDYGVIAILTSIIALLSTMVILGMDNSSARWFYDSDERSRRAGIISSWFWCQLLVSSSVAVLLFVFSEPIAQLLFQDIGLASLIKLAAPLIPLSSFSKVFGNLLRYQRKAWFTMIYFTASSLVTIGMIFLFVLVLKQGITGWITGQVLAAVLAGFVSIFLLGSWINPFRVSRTLLKEMLAFGLPLVPAAAAIWITASSDRLILQLFRETSEVGIYAIAASIAAGMALITTAFQMAWGPFAFSLIHTEESEKVYSKVLSIYALLGGFLGTALSLFSPWILILLTTPAYYAAVTSIPFLVFAYLAIGANYIFSLGAGIVKKSTPVALSIFIGAATSILLNFLLIPVLGKEGAAISNLTAYTAAAVYMYLRSQKLYPLPYRISDVLICFIFAWILIAIDRLFLPSTGILALVMRLTMLGSFIPLALILGIVRPAHFQTAWTTSTQSVRSLFNRH